MLYGFLKGMSHFLSLLPYKFVVRLGRNCGKLYWHIAKKQRIRAEETIQERMGVTARDAREIIHRLFLNLGMTAMEILYMPALNKDNIRGLVSFDRPDILWEALAKKRGVVMLACHMDNWEWLGAALALNGFPLSAVEKPQPNPVYSDFLNELGYEKGSDAGPHRRSGWWLSRHLRPLLREDGFHSRRPCLFCPEVQSPGGPHLHGPQTQRLWSPSVRERTHLL